jgi:hypothetical protein
MWRLGIDLEWLEGYYAYMCRRDGSIAYTLRISYVEVSWSGLLSDLVLLILCCFVHWCLYCRWFSIGFAVRIDSVGEIDFHA